MKKKFWKRFFVFVLLFSFFTTVFADNSCVLVAKTYLNVGHNSTATGKYRDYPKSHQVVTYNWTKIEGGAHGAKELYVELQKSSITGGKKVTSETISAYDNPSSSIIRFKKARKGKYRLYHSTRGSRSDLSNGEFIANNVIIHSED